MPSKGEETRERILAAAKKLVMQKGFTGTTIDDILKETQLTKGAFFHHFRDKAQLARELVEYHALKDLKMFEDFAARAEAESDDPLEQTLNFLKMFEAYCSNSVDPVPGCVYAVYTYESMQFEPAVRDFVADTLRRWTSIYVRRYQEVLDAYPPALPVTARQLAELTVSIIEGGLIFQRAYGDVKVTYRQSEQLRNYIRLLFGEARGRAAVAAE